MNIRNRSIAVLSYSLVLVLLTLSLAPGISSASSNVFDVHPDYPGLSEHTDHLAIVQEGLLMSGLSAYYSVYDEWPTSWAAVVDAGLFQARLYNFDMEEFDPDSYDMSGNGNVWYDPSSVGKDKARIVYSRLFQSNGEGEIGSREVLPNPVFSDSWPAIDPEEYGEVVLEYAQTENWHKLFAIKTQILGSISRFQSIHGRLPESMDEVAEFGLSPLGSNPLNPMTGGPLYFDGRPFNFMYEIVDGRGAQLDLIGADGEPIGILSP